jgi:hypothetical protein
MTSYRDAVPDESRACYEVLLAAVGDVLLPASYRVAK